MTLTEQYEKETNLPANVSAGHNNLGETVIAHSDKYVEWLETYVVRLSTKINLISQVVGEN